MISNSLSCSPSAIQECLVNCLSQQLSELELLKSMFPSNNEIILSDNRVLDEIQDFIDSKTDYSPRHLDFILKLVINELKLDFCVDLPSFYPKEEPDICVRCNQLNRSQETILNKELKEYLKNNQDGSVCLYTAISWLQENTESFRTMQKKKEKDIINDDADVSVDFYDKLKFTRLWVFSHHIYNKKKIEEIVSKSKQLNLTGFCLPGKPGIICVEGIESCTKEWWKHIKSMTWKKIIIRKMEIFKFSEQEQQQKFTKFEEIYFDNPNLRNSKHADMGRLYKYLENHGLTHALNELFGICNI